MHNHIIWAPLEILCGALSYLGLEIMRIVVSVLRVHWLLFQAFAHVAGIVISDAENSLTGSNAPGPSSFSETTIPDSSDVVSGVLSLNVFFCVLPIAISNTTKKNPSRLQNLDL